MPATTSLLYPSNTSDPDSLTLNAHDAQSRGDFQKMEGGNAKISYDVADWIFTSISDYKHFRSKLLLDDTALPVSLFNTDDNAEFQSVSEELRAYRDFHSWRLTSGLYYLYMHTNMDPSDQIFQPRLADRPISRALPPSTPMRMRIQRGRVGLRVAMDRDRGAGYTDDQKHYHYVQNVCPNFAACNTVFYPAQDLSREDKLGTGKVELEYHLADDMLLYASYNRGANPVDSTSR